MFPSDLSATRPPGVLLRVELRSKKTLATALNFNRSSATPVDD
jgi:hypothetical protein